MTETKAFRPVKKEEVEKNNSVAAVIPYVPYVEDTEKEDAKVQIKLPNGNKKFISYITSGANLESFLMKSIAAKNNIMIDLAYKAQAEKIEKEMYETNKKLKRLETNLKPAATATQADKSDKQKEAEAKKFAEAQEARKKQKEALAELYVKLEEQLKELILKMLDTFRGYIAEDLVHEWDDIISSKVGTKPWTNLQGEVNDVEELEYNLEAFEMIWMFWMRTVFQEDAAEQHLEYLTQGIRRPWNVPPRVFLARMKQLIGYIPYLPCAYYSSQATSQTTIPMKLTDPQLAQLALRLCPERWRLMWKTLDKGQPQDLDEMIKFMEQQESIDKSNRVKKPRHDGNNKGNKKRKGEGQNNQGSSKKTKRCALCAKHGGPVKTHNTADCRLYNSDGTRKRDKSNGEKKTGNNYAQLRKMLDEAQDEIKECQKEIKRLKKKRSYEEMDNDSDA